MENQVKGRTQPSNTSMMNKVTNIYMSYGHASSGQEEIHAQVDVELLIYRHGPNPLYT